jgi:hypothetical protein
MKKSPLLLTLPILLSLSCREDDPGNTGSVRLDLLATYADAPLVTYGQDYTYPDGRNIRFQVLNGYLSELVLVGEDGITEVPLLDALFFDFSDNTTPEDAVRPLTFRTDRLPVGNYRGLRLGVGVPAAMNTPQANQLPVGNPFRTTFNSHFWTDWGSFIFFKSEGIYDKDGNGIGQGDPGFGHHPGTDEVFRTVFLDLPFSVAAGKTTGLELSLDVSRLYAWEDGAYLDLSDPANLYTHNMNDLSVANQLCDQHARAWRLRSN